MASVVLLAALIVSGSTSGTPGYVRINHDSTALQFEYQWSNEAAAIPALDRNIRAKAEAAYRQALKAARADQAMARKDKRPFHQHFYDVSWNTSGRTPRLLSVVAVIETFTGGAHPNHNFAAELWDRRIGKPLALTSLFLRPSAFQTLTRAAYCKALDKERRSRRNGEKLYGEFDECPKYSELTIAPRDRQPNGRFETIEFIAAPYTAGPYAEGEYGIDLPVTRQLIAAIKPVYRASFEVQRQ
jgi:hypothetical protein